MFLEGLTWCFINIGFMACGYLTQYIKLSCSKCCNCCCILNNKNDLVIDYTIKTKTEIADTIMKVLLFGLLSFMVTNFFHDFEDYKYLLITLVTIPAFAIIGEIKGLQSSCSNASHWPIQSWIAYTFVGLLVLVSLGYNVFLSYITNILENYVIAVFTTILLYIIIYFTFVYTKINTQFHLHHWVIGYFLSMFMMFNDPISKSFFALYYGIFIEGVTVYSLESFFV